MQQFQRLDGGRRRLDQGGLGLVTGFGVDSNGELYVIGYTTGRLLKIVDTGAPFVPAVPTPAADFNEDQLPDILWQNQANGYLAAWMMNGTTRITTSLLTPDAVGDTNWKIVATARINSDFKTDIVWQNQVTGELALFEERSARTEELLAGLDRAQADLQAATERLRISRARLQVLLGSLEGAQRSTRWLRVFLPTR